MDTAIATIAIDKKKSKHSRDALAAWLHSKAEEIKNLDDDQYADKPRWNYYLSGNED